MPNGTKRIILFFLKVAGIISSFGSASLKVRILKCLLNWNGILIMQFAYQRGKRWIETEKTSWDWKYQVWGRQPFDHHWRPGKKLLVESNITRSWKCIRWRAMFIWNFSFRIWNTLAIAGWGYIHWWIIGHPAFSLTKKTDRMTFQYGWAKNKIESHNHSRALKAIKLNKSA